MFIVVVVSVYLSLLTSLSYQVQGGSCVYANVEDQCVLPDATCWIEAFFDVSGLILYNGQSQGSGDFVLFGLRDQTAEFRFDAGAGPVIIASEPLVLDIWHTARAKKHGKDGTLFL